MRVVAGFMAVSILAPGAAWADTTTERLVRLLEEQQSIIREQHSALMALLRDRANNRPADAITPPAPTAEPKRLQVAATSQWTNGGASPAATNEARPRWYAAAAGTITAPSSTRTNPADDCVFTSTSFGSTFANATSCDQTRQSRRSIDTDTNIGYGGSVAIGYRVLDWLRAEGQLGADVIGVDKIRGREAARRSERDAEGRAVILTGMANLYADIPTGTIITPYVGFGLGGFHADAQNIGEKDRPNADRLEASAFGVAVAGMAGLEFAFDDHWSASVGYRYLLLPDITAMTTRQHKGDATLDFHQVQFGLRRYF